MLTLASWMTVLPLTSHTHRDTTHCLDEGLPNTNVLMVEAVEATQARLGEDSELYAVTQPSPIKQCPRAHLVTMQ